jgi:hypothetical protein
MKTVFLKDTEVTNYIYNIPTIKQSISNVGSLMTIGDISIDGDKEFWNINNVLSPIYGIDYQYLPIKIIEDTTNVEIYKGLLRDFNITNESIQINITNRFDTIMNSYLPFYFESEQKTPAEIIRDLLEIYDIEYNATEFTKAIDIQESAGLQVTVQVTTTNNITLGSLITELCKASLSILGFINDKAVIYQYEPDIYPVISTTVYDKDIFNIQINYNTTTSYDGYRVIYSLSQMTLEGTNMYEDINLGEDQIITLYNPSGALWLGENYVNYYNNIKYNIELEIIKELSIIQLGSFIELNTDNYGIGTYKVVGLDYTDISIKLTLENI